MTKYDKLIDALLNGNGGVGKCNCETCSARRAAAEAIRDLSSNSPAPEGGLTEAYANGYSTAIETAAQHVGWQHVVWDMTDIPIRALLDMLEKNIRVLDGPPRPGEPPTPQLLPTKEKP